MNQRYSAVPKFSSEGIFGRIGDELTPDLAYRLGRAFTLHFAARSMVVACDNRFSSTDLKHAVREGLLDGGADVVDIGLAGSEELSFATSYLGVDGAVGITGCCYPAEYNGFRLLRKDALPVCACSGLGEVRKLVLSGNFTKAGFRGRSTEYDVQERYINHLLSSVQLDAFKPVTILINACNGAAGHVLDALEWYFAAYKVPVNLLKMNVNPDGSHPAGTPDPMLPTVIEATRAAVLEAGADIGVALDSDFDRCCLFDEWGNYVDSYYISGLLAQAYSEERAGQKIVCDPRAYWNMQEIVTRNGGKVIKSQLGRAKTKNCMRHNDAIYGADLESRHYFRAFSYCESGMLPWLKVAELVSLKGVPLSALVEHAISLHPISGEIQIVAQDAKQTLKEVYDYYHFAASRIDHSCGLSMEFEDYESAWRFNIRVVAAQRSLLLNVETDGDKELMIRKTREIMTLVKNALVGV